MTYLTDSEFRRLHQERIRSPEWKAFRRKCLEHYGYCCCVCGRDYVKRGYTQWQLEVDHRYYRRGDQLIFGHETFADVRVCCPAHHGKGVRSDASMRSWRNSYRWLRFLSWLVFLPFRLVWWVLRWFWKSVWLNVRSVD